ncbi:MAG: hypothetical protein BroJett018_34100 [Chloroflexota bacterium]|nr:MAG: hypothetical protein BroJett018_34100 [Chloroflexota bacterium]
MSGIGENRINKRDWVGGNSGFVGTQPVASVLKTPYPCDIRGIVLNRIPDKPQGVGMGLSHRPQHAISNHHLAALQIGHGYV